MSSGPQTSSQFTAAPAGESDARFETSAAWAQTEASTNKLSNEIGQNAAQLQNAAQQAATEAQQSEPQHISAVNQLEAGRALSELTNESATQGQIDVESVKAAAASTAASAVEQARNLANSAYQAAQSLFNGQSGSTDSMTGDFSSTVQSTATTAVQTGKEYLSSAQSVVQPHIEKAKNVISGTATSTATSQPEPVPASTAPLESGQHIVGNPYPATTTDQSVRVGKI